MLEALPPALSAAGLQAVTGGFPIQPGYFLRVDVFAEIDSLGPQRIWEGVTGRTVHGERATLSLIELDPGAVVPEHSHENEQIGLLLKGSLRFEIGGEARALTPGGTWRILAQVPHSVEVGPEGAVLVEVFSPARDDWHALEVEAPRPGRWP
jgi:quercetin dioxygenase-like cupin family protein